MRLTALALIVVLFSGCAMMKDLALDALSPNKGGISTEIVLGDKSQTLGTNQDVKAGQIGTVVGQNDNHTDIKSAEEVSIVNQNYPGWLILLLLAGNVLFLCLPTPTTVFNHFRKTK